MTSVEVVDNEAGFFGLEKSWRALFDASPAATPFQSWEWVETWWRHHGRGKPFILALRDGNKLVALLPLALAPYRGVPIRQLRFMGAPLSDYQQMIVGDDPATAAAAFLAELVAQRRRWDLADLNDIPNGTALAESFADGLRRSVAFHRACPVIRLGATWEAFSKSLGKNMRANVGRRRRQLEKQFNAELSTVSAEADLRGAMEDLYRLHNTRWQKRGASGAFSTAALQAFHHEVAERFLARGWLRLHRLKCDGQTKASFYCFARGKRVYYYLSGFDDGIGKFSPGNVMMAYSVQHAIAEGAEEFDLLRGDESYKYEWKAEDRSTVRMILGHGGVRSHIGTAGHRFERFVEHTGLRVQRRLWGRRKKKEATS
jgi:CelD/BcsL family acetyltransferase involved in cellulose biosynthesis